MDNIYCFVGENRSNKAKENGWTWESCVETGERHVCAIHLFNALDEIGINIKNQVFVNIWDDCGERLEETIPFLKTFEGTIVAMGRKVEKVLLKENIPHKFIFHPAARGTIRKKERYVEHVRQVLNSKSTS